MVALGQKLGDTPGTYVLGVDLKKFHQGGINHEINVLLRSSTQNNRETVINYANDRLRTGGNWFNGVNIPTAFGTPGNIHVDLTLNLDPVGTNSGEISWFEIGNESNNGSAPLPAGPSGELKYDEIPLLTFSGSGETVIMRGGASVRLAIRRRSNRVRWHTMAIAYDDGAIAYDDSDPNEPATGVYVG